MTKILVTVGPITSTSSSIKKLSEYSNLFRLNGSHNSIFWHRKIASRIKRINSSSQILIDIPGIKPRTNNNFDIKIKKNQKICFYYKKKPSKKNLIFVPTTQPFPKVSQKIKNFTLSDGSFSFKIIDINKNYIIGSSKNDFILKPKKGINIPNSIYDDIKQSKICLNFLDKIKSINFDLIGISFVQNEKIINIIKNKFPKHLIVSKIENSEGIKNIEKIIEYSDIIMIDRGDLSAEIGSRNLFFSIVKISEINKKYGKPIIMATENLESMISGKLPSKSEILSLGFYKSIDIDIVMLSDETATSRNYLDILKWLKFFLKDENVKIKKSIKKYSADFWDIIRSEISLPLTIFTKTGLSLNKILKLSSKNKIFLFTENKKVKIQTEFKKNITSFLIKKFPKKNIQKFIYTYLKKFKKIIFDSSELIVLMYISFPRKNSRLNTMQLLNKKDVK